MATFAEIRAQISTDTDRSDLWDQIGIAIKDAIALHSGERFWFNETRDYTFSTVNGTGEYTLSEQSGISDFEKVDYLKIQIGSRWEPMGRITPSEMEALHDQTQTGQPYLWSYYNKKFRFYPTPNATYSIRVAGHYLLPELSADSDENAWTTEARKMIEERAKGLLYASPIREPQQAAIHNEVADAFLQMLRIRTTRRTGAGRIKPWC